MNTQVIGQSYLFVLDPDMNLHRKTVSVRDVSLLFGHTLHYRVEPSLFDTILPYMNTVMSGALSKTSFYVYLENTCF